LQKVNVHRVRCIPPTSRWFPPGTPVSSTIKIQTVCIRPRRPLGRLAFMLKVSPSLNKVDYYYVAAVPRYAKNSILIGGHFEIQDGCL
jgi:hypothetical protein